MAPVCLYHYRCTRTLIADFSRLLPYNMKKLPVSRIYYDVSDIHKTHEYRDVRRLEPNYVPFEFYTNVGYRRYFAICGPQHTNIKYVLGVILPHMPKHVFVYSFCWWSRIWLTKLETACPLCSVIRSSSCQQGQRQQQQWPPRLR